MRNEKTSLKVSDHLELRLPETAYAEALFKIVDEERAYLKEWLSWVEETKSLAQIRNFLHASKLLNKGGQRLTTFIFYQNQLIGSIGFVKIDKAQKTGEIGYWISVNMQGKGIVSKACRRLIDYCFRSMDINRIEIKVPVLNTKSLKIPERLGFTYEGRLREAYHIRKEYIDLAVFSYLRKDWQSDSPA